MSVFGPRLPHPSDAPEVPGEGGAGPTLDFDDLETDDLEADMPDPRGPRGSRGSDAAGDDDEDDELADGPAEGWLHALRRSLDRPLTSYHLVLGVSGMLLALGLVMVLSASSVRSYEMYHGNSYVIFGRQVIWVLMGLPLAWLATRLPTRILRKLVYPALLLSLGLLALTFTSLGMTVNGNRNWLNFGGPFQIQPSEPAKLALVLWGADLYARKETLLTQWRHLIVPFVPASAIVLLLVLGQHDLGTALVLFSIVLVLLYVVGAPMRLFGTCVLAVGAVVTGLVLTESYRLSRLLSFTDPFADYRGTGWQAANAILALGTGGWWGVGIGASREKWGNLPEAHTDFIYAVIGEELGLAGTMVVLLLFLLLAFAGVRIALRAPDLFTRLGAAGIVGWLLSQALVNIATVLSLLPTAGLPLPLVSYGGSAMLVTLFALGVLVSFARNEPGARAALVRKAARRAARRRRRSGRDREGYDDSGPPPDSSDDAGAGPLDHTDDTDHARR